MSKQPTTKAGKARTERSAADAEIDAMSYEAATDELASIIEEIESGEIGLEASITAYERGSALIRRCRSLLDAAEQRVQELDIEHEPPSDDEPGER